MKIIISTLFALAAALASTAAAADSIRGSKKGAPSLSSSNDEDPKEEGVLGLRPQQGCYQGSMGTVVEDACSDAWLATCNNVPACAVDQDDAIQLGSVFCLYWTVWNNNEVICEWQYMCC